MLHRAHRMTRAEDYRDAIRRGSRAGCRSVVVHLQLIPSPAVPAAVRIGFIVNKAVGTAVMRNRVQRRLRHLLSPWVDQLPPGTLVVVRALPDSVGTSAAELARDVDSCLHRAWRKAERAVPA